MAYCTTDNLIDRYGADELLRLTDRDNNGFIDEQAVSAAIEVTPCPLMLCLAC
jgi:phage gp36-like protein